MCNKCQKLNELFAETQLECIKNNKIITKLIVEKCDKCNQKFFIVAETSDVFYMPMEEKSNDN